MACLSELRLGLLEKTQRYECACPRALALTYNCHSSLVPLGGGRGARVALASHWCFSNTPHTREPMTSWLEDFLKEVTRGQFKLRRLDLSGSASAGG